jgi:hypothetical protein
MNIARIAGRVAFGTRRAFDHVDQQDIKKLLILDPTLKESFQQLMQKHDAFIQQLHGSIYDLSDFIIRRLKSLKNELLADINSLLKQVKERFPGADLSSVKSKIDRVSRQEILNPNTMIENMNNWAYDWHDAFTKLAWETYELLTDEKNPRNAMKIESGRRCQPF